MKSLFLTLFSTVLLIIGQSCNSQSPSITQATMSKDSLKAIAEQNKSYINKKIYLYDLKRVDTIMKGYHISYLSQDNDSVIVVYPIVDEKGLDTSYYACRDILLTIQHEDDSSHVVITKALFNPFIPKEELSKYYINKFNIESVSEAGVTFYSNVCIPDTDLCYCFQLLISSKGNIQITDTTPDEDEL